MENTPVVVQNTHVQKNVGSGGGKAQIIGATDKYVSFLDVPQSANWREYYRMYRSHAIVRGAINTLVSTATNAGFDFVPRDSRTTLIDNEAKKLKDFFSSIPGFISIERSILMDLMIFGNGYLYVVPNKAGKPVSLKRLAPWTMRVVVRKNGEIVRYEQRDPDDLAQKESIKFDPQEIIHFKFHDPINDVYGLSPLEAIRLSVVADFSAQQYNIAFFQNAGVTGTIISIKNADPSEMDRTREYLRQEYTGLNGAHRVLVIDGEAHSVQKSVATHNEMNFLEGRRFLLQEILAVLAVPPAKIGIMETANRSNSKEQDKTFRTESVQFIQWIFEETLNDFFVLPILGIKNTVFKHQDSDTRDSIELMNIYTDAINHGVYTVNEVRARLGLSPIAGGDIAFVLTPSGAVPLEKMPEMWEQLSTVDPTNDPRTLNPDTKRKLPKPTPESRAVSGVSVTPPQ